MMLRCHDVEATWGKIVSNIEISKQDKIKENESFGGTDNFWRIEKNHATDDLMLDWKVKSTFEYESNKLQNFLRLIS